MNWYKRANSENDFDFSDEHREVWRGMCRQEQDDVGISFDMENDDSVGEIRRIKLKTKHESMKDIDSDDLAVFVQMYQAGGDWQCPVTYFRCQIKEKTRWGPKFIYIPDKKAGNKNLVPSKKKSEYTACDNNDQDCEDLVDKELWDSFKDHVEKRADEFYNKRDHDVNAVEEYGMYDNSKSLGAA